MRARKTWVVLTCLIGLGVAPASADSQPGRWNRESGSRTGDLRQGFKHSGSQAKLHEPHRAAPSRRQVFLVSEEPNHRSPGNSQEGRREQRRESRPDKGAPPPAREERRDSRAEHRSDHRSEHRNEHRNNHQQQRERNHEDRSRDPREQHNGGHRGHDRTQERHRDHDRDRDRHPGPRYDNGHEHRSAPSYPGRHEHKRDYRHAHRPKYRLYDKHRYVYYRSPWYNTWFLAPIFWHYPSLGYTVEILPAPYVRIVVAGTPYFYASGMYYRPHRSGYIVVAAPLGAVVAALPAGYIAFSIGLNTYYFANEVYYVWDEPRDGFVVVPKPEGAERAMEEATQGRLYVYPNKGQSEEQQAKDRYECHLWAVSETGVDPSLEEQDAPGSLTDKQKRDYKRAIAACLEGRAYTVK